MLNNNVIYKVEKSAPVEFLRAHPDKKYQELGMLLKEFVGKKEALITVLHKAQLIFGYMPQDVQVYVADALNVPISEVFGVVSFYSLFSMVPTGKFIISICMGTACYVKGANDVMEAFKEELKIDVGETTKDGLFTLRSARCLGACGLAPVLTINNDVHGKLTADDVPVLIEQYRKGSKKENTIQ